MTTQEYIEKIKESSIADDRKQQIVSLLEQNEFSFDIREQVKDIIQADIDASMEGILDGEDDSEVQAMNQQLEKDLAKVESTLNEDMAFVESQMDDIEKHTQALDKAMDEKDIEDLRTDISNS